MIRTEIVFCGQDAILVCDGKCESAYGINSRPSKSLSDDPDDFVWLTDDEISEEPTNHTWEGGEGRPDKTHNKWCARECERSSLLKPDEEVVIKDFSKPIYNIPRVF